MPRIHTLQRGCTACVGDPLCVPAGGGALTGAASCTTTAQGNAGASGGTVPLFQYDSTRSVAGKFVKSTNETVCKLKLYLEKTGTPTGNATIYLYSDNGGSPSSPDTSIATLGTIDVSTLGTTETEKDLSFTGIALTNTTVYWIVIQFATTLGTSNYVEIHYSGYVGAGTTRNSYNPVTTWSNLNDNRIKFQFYK